MAPKKQEDMAIARVGDVPQELLKFVGQMPAGIGDSSIETMKHVRVLDRVAIIQSNSPKEKKDRFGESALCVPASEMLLANKDTTVDVVPVFFFEEFISWGDRRDKEGPMIRGRSLDRSSALAQKSMNAGQWREAYGGGKPEDPFKMRHTHHLNFLCIVYSGEFKGRLVVVSFARSNWKSGSRWINLIRQRQIAGTQAPLFTTCWKLGVEFRKNDDGEWWGLSINNADAPWVSPEDIDSLQKMHLELKEDYARQRLSVGHEAAESVGSDDGAAVNAGSAADGAEF